MTHSIQKQPRNLFAKLLILAAIAGGCWLVLPLNHAISDQNHRNSARVVESTSQQNGKSNRSENKAIVRPANSQPVPADSGKGGSVVRDQARVRLASQPETGSGRAAGSSFRLSDSKRSKDPESKLLDAIDQLPIPQKRLELVEFDEVVLSEAMRLLAEQADLNIITSTEAGKTKVTVFLKNVTPMDALDAIVKTNGLFYRIESGSGIVRVATLREYEKDLSSFREEQTRVFTLLYPNPTAVAQVIQQVFGNRVQFNRADGEVEDLIELSRRFNRFDMVNGRSLGLGASQRNSTQANSGLNSNPLGSLGGLNSPQANASGLLGGQFSSGNPNTAAWASSQRTPLNTHADLRDLSADEIQQLENEVGPDGKLSEQVQADLMQRKDATIFVSTIRRNNQVIVRTGDGRTMDQIAVLIEQLDVPTPTVLLEVKVLRIALADGFNSAFEFLGNGNKTATTFSDGSLAPSFPGGTSLAQQLGDGLGVAGGVPGALTFQVVDKNFRARMQLLESTNCVTALATPLILTANNEVSRIFVGDTLPFTVGFTPSQVLSTVGSVNGAVAATPVTEMRDVGQSLLITPNINADRTVTLRIVEENSERVVGGSSIPVPATSGSGVTNINVDTVRRRTISGTVVAQDGRAVALGGMIEQHESNSRDQVPVLGNIPGIGFLFRRQASTHARSELVVIVRPYVFNTPSESAATSELLLGELSTHPDIDSATGPDRTKLPFDVTRSDSQCKERAKLINLSGFSTMNH